MKKLFSPPTHQGLHCPDERIWITVTFGRYLLMLNDVKNFGSADGFSDALHDEKQNKSNSKVGLILKCILDRVFGKKQQTYMVS